MLLSENRMKSSYNPDTEVTVSDIIGDATYYIDLPLRTMDIAGEFARNQSLTNNIVVVNHRVNDSKRVAWIWEDDQFVSYDSSGNRWVYDDWFYEDNKSCLNALPRDHEDLYMHRNEYEGD